MLTPSIAYSSHSPAHPRGNTLDSGLIHSTRDLLTFFPASGSLWLPHSRGQDTEHGDGASHKHHLHLQRSERNTSGYAHTHLSHWVCVQWNPKVFPPVVIFWGLKDCNSIIRFSDPGATCLSDWVGTKLRG